MCHVGRSDAKGSDFFTTFVSDATPLFMNTLDIVLLIPLIIAAFSGWRNGFIVQACGIAGIVLGIILALRMCHSLAQKLNLPTDIPPVLAFVMILVLCVVVLWGFGYLFRNVVRISGFGLFDRIGGLILGTVKIGLLLSVLMGIAVRMNSHSKLLSPSEINSSKVCKQLHSMTETVFPYIVKAKDLLFESLHEENCSDPQHDTKLADTK